MVRHQRNSRSALAHNAIGESAGSSKARGCCVNRLNVRRLTSVTLRASKVMNRWNPLGQVVEVAKDVASPSGKLYNRNWYHKELSYDGAGRVVRETTGGRVNTAATGSWVETSYTRRGAVKQVNSSHGLLVHHVRRNGEGQTTELQYADGALTTAQNTSDWQEDESPAVEMEYAYDASDQRASVGATRADALDLIGGSGRFQSHSCGYLDIPRPAGAFAGAYAASWGIVTW